MLTIAVTEKYFELLPDRKIKGYMGMEKNYFQNGVPEGYFPKTAAE